METTVEIVLNALIKSIPYPEQINNLKIVVDWIYFDWRGDKFKIETTLFSIYQIDDGCLVGSNVSILLRELIKLKLI